MERAAIGGRHTATSRQGTELSVRETGQSEWVVGVGGGVES